MDFTAAWLSRLLSSLDDELSPEQKRAVFAGCSTDCTAPWATKAAELRRQLPEGTDVSSLLAAFCAVLPGGGPEVHVDGSYFTWRFAPGQCPCPVGQLTRNPAVCPCGTEHVRGMLEPLLGRPLAVTLEQSLLHGDDCCAYSVQIGRG